MGKDLQTRNGQNKLALWAGQISECRNSGQEVKVWCREKGIFRNLYLDKRYGDSTPRG